MFNEKEIQLINSGDSNTPFRILQNNNEEDLIILRKQSIDIDINVNEFSTCKELQLFIERLKKTLQLKGVGIAAPQVELNRNIFLFLRVTKTDRPVQVVINPKITNRSENIISFERDGCLSIPDESGNTDRHDWIDVEYYDENGKLIKERLTGESRETDFTGVIFQHEFDHLNGILFIDRLTTKQKTQ